MITAALTQLRITHTWWAMLVAALVLTNCATGMQRDAARRDLAGVNATFATYQAESERLAREAEAKNRQTETELRNAQETHAQEVAQLQAGVERSRAAAHAAAGRLQDAARAAAERARAQCANPAAAELGTPAGDAVGMLAYVLGLADERAGRLADIAEQRGIAGNACVRAYNEAREALKAN